MADKVLTWTRFDTYVTERSGGVTYHARCGCMDIAGHYWDGFERLGKVALDEGVYKPSAMYLDPERGYVVNPWHHQMVPSKTDPKVQVRAGILFHPATVPSNLEGCVTAGWIYDDKMTESSGTLAHIWRLAGGSKANPKPTLTVRVVGTRTPWHNNQSAKYLEGLKPYTWP